MSLQSLIFVGIFINFLGVISYIKDILKGKVKPNRVTFFMWSFAPFVAFAAQIEKGVGAQAWMTLSVGIFPLLILIASFLNKKAYWKLTTFDMTCGALSMLGLLLWYITKEGNVAILFTIIADGLAALPTLVKAYHHPETETSWPWLASSIGGVLTLLTITTWNFEHYGFPLSYLIIVLAIYLVTQFKLGKKRL